MNTLPTPKSKSTLFKVPSRISVKPAPLSILVWVLTSNHEIKKYPGIVIEIPNKNE